MEPWKRKEVIGDCTLYLGDCREILPTLPKVDAVVTDPPYGIGAGQEKPHNGWADYGISHWDNSRPERSVFDAILSLSQEAIIWGGNYFTDYLPPTMQWLVWDKGQRNFSLADCEFAWSSNWNASRIFSYSRGEALKDGKVHPTQKPIALMKWCLGFLPKAKTICDPYMGSGTTGIACVNLGLAFIGIELDETHFKTACRRIRRAYEDQSLLTEIERPKETQPDLFRESA